ncbi:hypothetical protein [Kordia sp.]|uniref:hypothetical protein n=1 Tax=Kordia sp. TaxID=1965332 RepID=UPI003D6BE312
MFKTSLASLVLVILLCVSCKSKTNLNQNIEGAWIQAYYQYNSEYKDPSGTKFFLNFKDNKVRIKKIIINNKDKAIDTIVNFTLKDGKITYGNDASNIMEVKVTKDSLVMTSNYSQPIHTVFKRLSTNSKKVHWNPKGKEYVTSQAREKIYYDFVNDTEMHFRSKEIGLLTKTNWEIQHINDYTFLVYESEFYSDEETGVLYVLLDSLAGNKVYVTDYIFGNKQYVFEEQEIAHKKPRLLFGTWKLVSKEEIVQHTTQIESPGSMNGLDKLYIEEDSIIINRPPFKPKVGWKYYEDDKTIILKKLNRVLQVSKVSKDSLVLEMDLSQYGFDNKRFTFIRE